MKTIDFSILPKVELHLHLDTSMRLDTIRRYLIREGEPVPEPLEFFAVAPPKCTNLMDYLARIEPALRALQSVDAIEETAYQIGEDLAATGHLYAEVRFAPTLNTLKGETVESIFDAAIRGFRRVKTDFGLEIGLILCALRHAEPEANEPITQLALHRRPDIAGFDLAGDESLSGRRQRYHFDRIRAAEIPITVHAAEAWGPDRLTEALDELGAWRIGHGVRLEEDPELLKRVIDYQIPLEMCPTSNVQTNATADFSSHPIDRYLKLGVPVTVNTDSMSITPTTLTREYEILNKTFGWGLDEFVQTQLIAIDHSFLPSHRKAGLRHAFLSRIAALER